MIESEVELLQMLVADVPNNPVGLSRVIASWTADHRVLVTCLLSVPERVHRHAALAAIVVDELEWGDHLARGLIHCLSSTEGGSGCSVDVLVSIVDRGLRLHRLPSFGRMLVSKSLSSSCVLDIDKWAAVCHRLPLDMLHRLVLDCLVSTPTSTPTSTAGDAPCFPCSLDPSSTRGGGVVFSLLDQHAARLAQLFNGRTLAGGGMPLVKYLINKLPFDRVLLHDLPARYVLVRWWRLMEADGCGWLPALFAGLFWLWGMEEWAVCQSDCRLHALVSDLLVLSAAAEGDGGDGVQGLVAKAEDCLASSVPMRELFSRALGFYLDHGDLDIRRRGLLTAQAVAAVLLPDGASLDFELDGGLDVDWVNYLRSGVPHSSFSSPHYLLPSSDTASLESVADTPVVANLVESGVDDSDDCSSIESFCMDHETKRQISAIPPPRFLQECVDYLNQRGNEEFYHDRVYACLDNIQSVLDDTRKVQSQLSKFSIRAASTLCYRLLVLQDPGSDDGAALFSRKRFDALVALVRFDPCELGVQLIHEMFNSPDISILRRLELLNVLLASLAQVSGDNSFSYLAATAKSGSHETINQLADSHVDRQLERGILNSIDDTMSISQSKTKITHPRSLELSKMRNKTSDDGIYLVRDAVKRWIMPMCRGLWTSNLHWLKKDAGTIVTVDGVKDNNMEVPASSLSFFCKLLVTLLTMLQIAGPNDPDCVQNCREVGYMVSWFWNLISTSHLRTSFGGRSSAETDKLVIQNSKVNNLLGNPETRKTVLFVVWSALTLENALGNGRNTYRTILPFQWEDRFGPESLQSLLRWMTNDICVYDQNVRNKKLASWILQMMQRRINITGS